ncbi:4Fe-4S binding protein [Collinsella sp. zg1085]|uniref:NADH-ubiquinone oxidoreductase-F iron-sulfur binding region domain-containing protein n=1 Tax=Collinsella sp. zg1085 TaxID=2844380 RepID=UPI001C0A9EE9|nr:NADH-ubiquinone oxidoreductase-F iron-sulfur binding region domain-containing protein [Collinsella sp. zg1085]QWT17683.1 4Fe-4S binding protein [Collinsella sp. zg1085]
MNIISFMSVRPEKNIGRYLISTDAQALGQKLATVENPTVVIPAGDTELKARLQELLGAAASFVEADASFGYVYGNETALLALTRGQMPVPMARRGQSSAVTLHTPAHLWADEHKRWLWIDNLDAPCLVSDTATVGDILAQAGVSEPKAVYFEHPDGRMLDVAQTDEIIPVDCEWVRVFTQKDCMAHALADMSARHFSECCGRCVFGYEGAHQSRVITNDIINKRGKSADLALLRDLAPVMSTQSLCELGTSLATTIVTSLEHFGTEIEAHMGKKQCPSGACSAYMTFHIMPSLCTGCCDCVDACEEDAIMSKKGFVHVIDQKACTACGACVDACDEDAIITAGAEKPRTPPRPIPCKRR